MTTERDARDNLDQLGNAYGNAHNEHLIAYRLAYNPTQGALLDLVDVFAQKLNEYPGATFAMIVRAFLGRVRDPLPVPLADELQRILIERIRGTGYVSLNDTDLALVVDRVRRQRMSGAKTLLVPHSQGSLYANSAYALLTQGAGAVPAKSLAIVAVASPAAYVAGANGRHVTSRQDLVIFGLRKLLGNGSVLPGNVRQPLTLDDPLGHSFQAIYLRPNTNARTKLLSDIAAVLDSLRTERHDQIDSFLLSGARWDPEIVPKPPLCGRPARLVWEDGWSNPGQREVLRMIDGDHGELEGLVTANLRACYAKALNTYKSFLLGEIYAPPWMTCFPLTRQQPYFDAWRIHSGDGQVMTYSEEVDFWSVPAFNCPDGLLVSPNVKPVHGTISLGYQCNR
ncbi:MAG: hypothetical protein ACK4V1_11465 [Burkholderiaceae bacterium]